MMPELHSPRLRTLASLVPEGSRVADIGTDHAYLPVYLVGQGICPLAVAGEVNPGPFQAARQYIRGSGLEDRIRLRFGNGLEVLEPGEVDTIVIAGMGGTTIRDILSAQPEKLTGVKRLILQPMVWAPGLRRWLVDQGWRLTDEELVEEDGRIYAVMVAESGEGAREPREAWVEWGPRLLEKGHPLLRPVLEKELAEARQVWGKLQESQNPKTLEKKDQLETKIKTMEEVLLWLSAASKS